MKLTELELQLCAVAFDKELKGLELPEISSEWDEEYWTQRQQEVKGKLLEEGMMELIDGKYRFSDFGQLVLNILGDAECWLVIKNDELGAVRRIYVKGANYLCLDQEEDGLRILYLPLLPLAVGAYAQIIGNIQSSLDIGDSDSMKDIWEKEVPYLYLYGCSGSTELNIEMIRGGVAKKTKSGETSYVLYTEESCVNAITMWLLKGLKESDGVTDGE